MGGNESKINVANVGNSDQFRCGECNGSKNTLLKEKVLREKAWNIKPDVIAAICTDFSEALFEAIVTSSCRTSRIVRLNPVPPG